MPSAIKNEGSSESKPIPIVERRKRGTASPEVRSPRIYGSYKANYKSFVDTEYFKNLLEEQRKSKKSKDIPRIHSKSNGNGKEVLDETNISGGIDIPKVTGTNSEEEISFSFGLDVVPFLDDYHGEYIFSVPYVLIDNKSLVCVFPLKYLDVT